MRKLHKKSSLVYGHGINDANYAVLPRINGKQIRCPFYRTWQSMLQRVYSQKYHDTNPTYVGITVCQEWLIFSNFKAWLETQNWQGNELDKDIIKPGNKHYSPDTCCFVPHALNSLLNDNSAARGEWIIGVRYNKFAKKYTAQCCDGKGKLKHLGSFDTASTAHAAWVKFKSNLIVNIAAKQTDPRIVNGLMRHAARIAIGG